MSDGPQFPPVSFQESWINSSFNSTIVFAVLMGIYSIVFFGTIYLYLTREHQFRWFVVFVISAQYLLSALEFGLQWYLTQWEFVRQGTRETVFLALTNFPAWVQILFNVLGAAITSLADSLLVWRCFYVWNRSFRAVGLLLFLLWAEIVLFSVSTITPLAKGLNITLQLAITVNDIQATAYVVSAATSLLATVLIGYKIYHVVNESNAIFTSRIRFRHIMEILVQSAAVYAVIMVVQATSLFLPGLETSPSVFALDNYAVALMIPIAGIAPCAMIARVSASSPSSELSVRSTVYRLPGLEFREHSTSDNSTQAESSHINAVEDTSARVASLGISSLEQGEKRSRERALALHTV